MTYMKNIAIAACIAVSALNLPGANGNPYVISDNRVRSLDVTPVLGRGYSIMTNSFQSTCLNVQETTIPSFNYDYSFYDFTGSEDKEVDLATSLSSSFAYDELSSEFASTYSSTTSTSTQTFYIIANMRIERYYASVKDEASTISDAALTLLDRADYVGFFKSCGPTYVRSIRRVQEVNTMFKIKSSSVEGASSFASSLTQTGDASKNSTETGTTATDEKFKSISSSMTIKITGYGLGLTEAGSETLVATSLAEFQGVMKFAYNLMTKNPNAIHIGMVFGIEVVPWVENVLFQVAAEVQDVILEIPLARSLIPHAYPTDSTSTATFDNTSATARLDFRCKNPINRIDKYGYCCEPAAMYDYEAGIYNADNLDQVVCRPIRQLDHTLIKENLSSNGEFVARLDSALRYKTNRISNLQMCISSARGFPDSLDNHYLKPNADPMGETVVRLTLWDMKRAIDPMNDYSLVTHMGKELDEFISMFYGPCLAALFGANAGSSSSTDTSFFMAYPWHTHRECTYMSCLADGMRWNREEPGCVMGLLSGPNAAGYGDSDGGCDYDTESGGASQTCKNSAADMTNAVDRLKQCWGAGVAPQMYMDQYCMPRLDPEKMDAAAFATYQAAGTPTGCTAPAATSPVSRRRRKLSVSEMHNQQVKEENRRRRGL